jgi:predicted PurR-regulated permease PerM
VRFRIFRRRGRSAHAPEAPERRAETIVEPEVVQLDEEQLREMSAVFAAPRWLRDLGFASWLTVGAVGLLVGLVWLLGLTETIVTPVLAGLLLAVVASPAVRWLQGHRVPRAAGAGLVLLAIVALGVLISVLVVAGIKGQAGTIRDDASAAADTIQGWLEDAGVDESGASSAMDNVEASVPDIIHTLVNGLGEGISGLTSLIFGLSFAVFSLFFLLKDGPVMRRWVDRHLGVPQPVAQTITGGVIRSLRGYFAGVTIVAAFNALVISIGALILGVPLVGTIAVVTFVTAYVPYVGAFVAGTFAFLIALGAEGTETAVILTVIFILGNGPLQQLVQPFALGATLRLNPLVVLIVTIGAGALFGMAGLVLSAPIVSAVVHISAELARARAAAGVTAAAATEPAGPGPPVQESEA